MSKKVKENEPHQKKGQGKCASLNATTFCSYVNKQIMCNLYLMPQFMNSQTV